jgi:hypothetical protein
MRFGICGVGFAAILAFFLVVAAGETAGEYEEYHTVDMQPLDKVDSPIGKNPLGFCYCYRIHSEGSHQYSEDSFSEIVANLMHDQNKYGVFELLVTLRNAQKHHNENMSQNNIKST